MINQDILRQMRLADTILERTSFIDPSSIIAGGAPRNWFIDNKAAKDIDVYVRMPSGIYENTNVWVDKFFRLLFSDMVLERNRIGSPYIIKDDKHPTIEQMDHGLGYIIQVHECKIEDIVVQFIFIHNTVDDILSKFDNSLCKIYYKDSRIIIPDIGHTWDIVNPSLSRVKGAVRYNPFTLSLYLNKMFYCKRDYLASNHCKKLAEYYPNYSYMDYTQVTTYIRQLSDLVGDMFANEYYDFSSQLYDKITTHNIKYKLALIDS